MRGLRFLLGVLVVWGVLHILGAAVADVAGTVSAELALPAPMQP